MEDACNNYHCLPYKGGLLDQPIYILESFNVIRGEKNRYERVRADKLMKNIEKK